MKKIGVLYYDGFCEFEVVIALSILKAKGVTAVAVAVDDRVYEGEEGQRYLPDRTLRNTEPDELDLLLIPGGNPAPLFECGELKEFMLRLHRKQKLIAGICGGAILMASYGLLDGRKCTGAGHGLTSGIKQIRLFDRAVITAEDVVFDGHLGTSTGKAYVELAFELAKRLEVYEDETERENDYLWYKNLIPVTV